MALKNAYMKQSKCPLMDETDKENVACRYNGISFSLYKKETPFMTTWMDLEDNKLTEISQSQKGKYCVISLNLNRQTHRKRVEWWFPGPGGRGKRGGNGQKAKCFCYPR